jgi:pSer/pThr/pTyr-binding forkhead associated (FHA) protein
VVHEFEQITTMGRGEESDMRVDDPALSRKHAVLSIQGEKILVEDLGSTNGLVVDGKQVRQAVLKHGGEFAAGDSVFRVSISGPGHKSHTRVLRASPGNKPGFFK